MSKSLKQHARPLAARIGVEPGNFIGVCLAIFSGIALMANGAIGKLLGGEIHPFLVTFFRSIIIMLLLFPWFARKGYHLIRPTSHRQQFLNGIVFTAAMVGWFWALPRTPLDMVAGIGFTSQLYAIIGAILFLGEKPRLWRWLALLVGFAGAMIIVRPGFIEFTPGILVLIITAVLFSTNRLMIKVIATKDNPETSVVWMSFWASIFTFPLAIFFWQIPDVTQALLLIFIALLTIVSHYSLAWALKLGDIGAIEPTTFMRLIWGALFGFFLFGDIPNIYTIIGALIVFASIAYIARRERREGKQRMPMEEVTS